MRKFSPLDNLFPRTRQAILAVTLMHVDRWWYLSDLARHLSVVPSSLQRELSGLVEAGILRRRRDGNRVYFQANRSCPFFPELRGLIAKTVGLVNVLGDAFKPLAERIDWAFVFGSIARGEETSSSDVDLMIIGQVGLAEVSPALSKAEKQLQRAVNASVYTRKEFAQKAEAGHHFVRDVLEQEKLFILGDARELADTFGGPPCPTA